MSTKGRAQAEKTPTPDRTPAHESSREVESSAASHLLPIGERRVAALSEEDLLALQRSVGNAAVQRLVAPPVPRDSLSDQEIAPEKDTQDIAPPAVQLSPGNGDETAEEEAAEGAEYATGLNADMLQVQGGQPDISGNVSAQAGSEDDTVTVQSPQVTFNASVSLNPDVNLGPGEAIEVGPVQTLMGSDRVGVYRRGGDPDGEILAEKHVRVGEVRDAMWQEGESGPEAIVEEPWYSRPERVSDLQRQANVGFRDQPGFDLPSSVGEGRLTETSGQDRFRTALSAKRGETLVHLTSSQWQVPWDVTINQQLQGEGAELTGGSSEEGPTTTEGEIAVAAAEEWVSFPTVEAALGASTAELLQNLAPTFENDFTSWTNIVEALRQRNPTITVGVTVEETAEALGADEIMVRAVGGLSAERGPFTLNDGESVSLGFSFSELFPNPGAISGNSTIEFRVWDAGWLSHEAATMSWPCPFHSQTSPARMSGGGGGRYTMTGSIG